MVKDSTGREGELLVLSRAFRPFLNAVFAGLAAGSALFTAIVVWGEQNSVAGLLLGAGALFGIVAVDAAIPSKFRVDRNYLHYRNTYIWTSWPVELIERIEVNEETWFGVPVSTLFLHMKDDRTIALTDTACRRSDTYLKGGSGWAAQRIADIAEIEIRPTDRKPASGTS